MPPSQRPKRSKGAEGSAWRRTVKYVVNRDAGKCHICNHFGGTSADHLVPDTEGGSSTPDNLKAVHGYPHPCKECSAAAGKNIFCNEIRGAMSVVRARRIIEERTGLVIGRKSGCDPREPEGRDFWLPARCGELTVVHAQVVPEQQERDDNHDSQQHEEGAFSCRVH